MIEQYSWRLVEASELEQLSRGLWSSRSESACADDEGFWLKVKWNQENDACAKPNLFQCWLFKIKILINRFYFSCVFIAFSALSGKKTIHYTSRRRIWGNTTLCLLNSLGFFWPAIWKKEKIFFLFLQGCTLRKLQFLLHILKHYFLIAVTAPDPPLSLSLFSFVFNFISIQKPDIQFIRK